MLPVSLQALKKNHSYVLILRVKTPKRYPLQSVYCFEPSWVNHHPVCKTTSTWGGGGHGALVDIEFQLYLLHVVLFALKVRLGRALGVQRAPLCHLPRNPSRLRDVPQVGQMPILSPLLELRVLWCVCTQPCVFCLLSVF